ncbi:hypothetical protein FRC11_002709 [Ceratobasidium sp. 423]|nr:hypothetical protein FRC11_002709 [Ceratobasidium sp. 423]
MEEAKENPIISLNYLIIESNPLQIQLGNLTFWPSQRPKFVFQIKGLIDRNRAQSIMNYSVHKADLAPGDVASLQEAGINPPLSEPLTDGDSISQHWPQGFDSDSVDVVLRKPTGAGQNPGVPSTEVDVNEAELHPIQKLQLSWKL